MSDVKVVQDIVTYLPY